MLTIVSFCFVLFYIANVHLVGTGPQCLSANTQKTAKDVILAGLDFISHFTSLSCHNNVAVLSVLLYVYLHTASFYLKNMSMCALLVAHLML